MMNEQSNHSEPRTEQLLRQWGAQAAADAAETPSAPGTVSQPAPTGQGERRVSPLLRWGPLAAGVALVIAGAAFFVASRSTEANLAEQLSDLRRQADRLEVDLARAAGQGEQVQAKLLKAKERLAVEKQATENVRAKLEQLERTTPSEAERQVALVERKTLDARIVQLESQLNSANRRVGQINVAYESVVKQAGQSNAKVADLSKRLKLLSEEWVRFRKLNDETIASQRKAEIEVAALKSRNAIMMANIQRAYLEAASREIDLDVRQAAVRRGKLLERYAKLRRTLGDDSTGQLMDRLEVILTRLELLDPQNVEASESFYDFVGRSALEAEIDRMLKSGLVGPELQTWLFEVKLILTGAGRVG